MELLTPNEVAARTKLAVATLAKLRVRGGGPSFIKLGASVRYKSADVDAWIERRSTSHVRTAHTEPTAL